LRSSRQATTKLLPVKPAAGCRCAPTPWYTARPAPSSSAPEGPTRFAKMSAWPLRMSSKATSALVPSQATVGDVWWPAAVAMAMPAASSTLPAPVTRAP
jgi:hypothetical protein